MEDIKLTLQKMVKTRPFISWNIIIANKIFIPKPNYVIQILLQPKEFSAQTESIKIKFLWQTIYSNKKAFEKIIEGIIYARKSQTEGLVQSA